MSKNIVQAWRIVRGTHGSTVEAAFDGEGSRIFGGRWNMIDTPAVYIADSRALGLLELLVNTKDKFTLVDIHAYQVQIPAELIEYLPDEDLPVGWESLERQSSSQLYGETWFQTSGVPVLRVPSVVVVGEYNYVLNPQHPKFKLLKLSKKLPLPIDPRLLR